MKFRPAATLALLFAAGSAVARAQAPTPAQTPKPFTLEVDVDLVSITAVVHDKAGRFISGLGPRNVQVFEDGVAQDVSIFQEAKGGADKIPLSIALVLDASGSMKPNMTFLQEAASSFIGKLEPEDEALVVGFNESVKGSAEFTSDQDRLENFIQGLQAFGGTSLYDALQYALERIKDRPGRKAVIIFSDGDDTTSGMGQKPVVDYARSVEATIYSVGIRGGTTGEAPPKGFLKTVADETGGQYFFPDRVGELLKIFTEISAELHQHYLLAYSPKKPPDSLFRKIEVKVDRPDAVVRVRKGYFATKRRKARG